MLNETQVAIGVLFSLSVVSVFARIGIRFHSSRKLSLDDCFVLVGLVSLSAVTALAYKTCNSVFLTSAVERDPRLILRLSPDAIGDLLKGTVQYLDAFIVLCWTAVFSVKFSFLAFFRHLIRRVENIHKYYWTVVGITVVSWAFLTSEVFILCPYTGTKSGKIFYALDGGESLILEPAICFDRSRNLLYKATTGLVTGLDVLTDIMSGFFSPP